MKKLWAAVIGCFAVLLGALGWLASKNKTDEAALNTSKADIKDAALEQKQKDIEAQKADVSKAAEDEKAKTLTTDETVEFLKKL